MSVSSLMILFALYSLIGWAMETVYCSIPAQKFVYRGFLYGPVCPIYGFGALGIVMVLMPFRNHPELIFIFGIILASVLEYGASFLLEKLFKKSWWDYSDKKFNINGRVCLLNSTFFGILSLLLVYILHPMLADFLTRIPETMQAYLAAGFAAVFCIDLFLSVRNTLDFNREMHKLTELTEIIEKKRDEIKASMDIFRVEQREKLELELTALLDTQEESLTIFMRRMHRILDAFPHMRLQRKDKLSLRDHLMSYRWKK